MRGNKLLLRSRFEAETDIVLEDCKSSHWKQYALWLEKLSIKKINSELVNERHNVQAKIRIAFRALEEAISGRV